MLFARYVQKLLSLTVGSLESWLGIYCFLPSSHAVS